MAAARKKRAPPPAPSFLSRNWRWPAFGVVIGAIAAIIAAISGLPKAVEVAEPYVPATHGHVKMVVDPIQHQADMLTYWRLEDQKQRAKAEEGGWSIQLQKEKDPQARELIQKQIVRAQEDQKKIDLRVQHLKLPDLGN